jgi:hypothetical protein
MGTNLEAFAETQRAVSVFGAYGRKFIGVAVASPSILKSFFVRISFEFISKGNRLKFDLTGLEVGKAGMTTWELQQVLKQGYLEAGTDFFKDGVQLTGKKLEQALKPWRP